eukprot:scaffold59752_cov63-Phaeocystis_antarctica.AAC.5
MARAHSAGGAGCGGLARRVSRLLVLSLRLGRRRRSGITWRWPAAWQREERRGLVARERVVLVPVEEGVLARLVLHESRQVGHLRGAEHAARLEHGVRSNLVELGRRHVDLVLIVLTGWKLRHPGGQEVAPSVEPAHAQPSLHLVAPPRARRLATAAAARTRKHYTAGRPPEQGVARVTQGTTGTAALQRGEVGGGGSQVSVRGKQMRTGTGQASPAGSGCQTQSADIQARAEGQSAECCGASAARHVSAWAAEVGLRASFWVRQRRASEPR